MTASNDPTRRADTAAEAPAPTPPEAAGGLQFLDLIGKGGFGAVYRATDDRLGRVVAAKVLLDDSSGRERFLAEAMITGNLQHPHIIPVHSLSVDPRGRDFFTMPVVQGRGLDEILRALAAGEAATTAEFTLPRLIAILVAVADAVAYAHARGVVHRDLKPQNIMLGRFGEVFVLDWGIAKLMHRPAPAARENVPGRQSMAPLDAGTVPTLSGTVIGTPGYMSPEQARGETEEIAFPADVYALGVILFQMLSLRMPVDTTTAESAMVETAEGRLRDVHAIAGARHVPRALAAIARKAMTLAAEERYPDAATVVADLRAWLEDREVSASPDDAWRRVGRWLRHHRVAAALIGGTVASAAVAAIAVLALVSGHNAERARLAETAQSAAERASGLERAERERLQRRAAAFSAYLPGLNMLERAEWNAVWAPRALAAFDRALAADPDFAEAHRARGRALAMADRARDALAAYERALVLSRPALGHDDPELMRSIGDLLWMKLSDIPAATVWFRRAAAADPANPHARVAKAIVRSMDGEHADAIAELRALAAEAPDWWEVQQALGMLLIGASPRGSVTLAGGPKGISDPAGAEAAFSEAIRLRPGYAQFYVHRGMARTMQYFGGDQRRELLDGCLADYDIAVLLAPEWLNAHTARLQANFYEKRSKVVAEELDILRRMWPKDPLALRTRALAEVPAGRGKALLAEVEAALAEQPGSPVLLKLREELSGKSDKPAPPAGTKGF